MCVCVCVRALKPKDTQQCVLLHKYPLYMPTNAYSIPGTGINEKNATETSSGLHIGIFCPLKVETQANGVLVQ